MPPSYVQIGSRDSSSQGNWRGQCPPVEYIEFLVVRLLLILERWYDYRHDFVILFV